MKAQACFFFVQKLESGRSAALFISKALSKRCPKGTNQCQKGAEKTSEMDQAGGDNCETGNAAPKNYQNADRVGSSWVCLAVFCYWCFLLRPWPSNNLRHPLQCSLFILGYGMTNFLFSYWGISPLFCGNRFLFILCRVGVARVGVWLLRN